MQVLEHENTRGGGAAGYRLPDYRDWNRAGAQFRSIEAEASEQGRAQQVVEALLVGEQLDGT
ncbi:MAG TPA: hypothetical protein VIK91_26730, partial [Nannocystis sp.]